MFLSAETSSGCWAAGVWPFPSPTGCCVGCSSPELFLSSRSLSVAVKNSLAKNKAKSITSSFCCPSRKLLSSRGSEMLTLQDDKIQATNKPLQTGTARFKKWFVLK